jgi:hypothetical protein
LNRKEKIVEGPRKIKEQKIQNLKIGEIWN